MERPSIEVNRLFTVEGPDAALKMERLVDFARTLGGFAVSEVGPSERLATGPESAISYLQTLLAQPGPYRASWAAHARKTPPDEISQAGVTRVLADWLSVHGNEDGMGAPTARRLKDKVSRTFAGRHVSPEVLGWFIEAFELSDEHRNTLLATYLNVPETDVPPRDNPACPKK